MLIVQHPEILDANPSDYRGQAVDTTEVTIYNIGPTNIQDVVEKLQGLATLLSLVTCSQVVLHGWECPGANPSAKYWSVIGSTGCFRPMLKIRDGKIVREFLEQVWRSYFMIEHPRKLRVAIDYFVSAQVLKLPLELELLTMFVLLENLKATFASSRGYQYHSGFYQKPSGGRWSFKGLLLEMFNDVDMNPSIDSIKSLRDEIIHSGISQLPFDMQMSVFEDCQDVVREYFMRLIGFSGTFFLYSGRGMRNMTV